MGLLLLFPLGTRVLSAASREEVGLSSERLARLTGGCGGRSACGW
jgi:hypothetical protein